MRGRVGQGVTCPPGASRDAALLAKYLLAPLADRWLHSRAVGERAQWVRKLFGIRDGNLVVTAAYLHDIGYSPLLVASGVHGLDGARFLASLGHYRLASLVAHHSASRLEAQMRGLSSHVGAFPMEPSAVADALTYCDMTVGPRGEPMTLQGRVADIEDRYGTTHHVTRAVRGALPELSGAVRRTERRLHAAGLLPAVTR